jgi:hypothetical protein
MKVSRRVLLGTALGAVQLGLLQRFGLGRARATPRAGSPQKHLAIWIAGGLHFESFFCPLSRAGIEKFIPAPTGGTLPFGYVAEQVKNFDGTPTEIADAQDLASEPRSPLRGPIYWDPADPSRTDGTNEYGQIHQPWGRIWADPRYRLWERAILLVGADQGTAAHESGIVASMCGVAGGTFRAPAVQAVIANALSELHPDRPIPNVSLGGRAPVALRLPSIAAPTSIASPRSVVATLSDRRSSAWTGLRERTDVVETDFDGVPTGGTVPLTLVDRAVLDATRSVRGRSNRSTDEMLEQLYDTYKNASRVIARDVVSTLESIVGFEHTDLGWTACLAGTCGGTAGTGELDFALRLLKSNLTSSVTMRLTSINNTAFDTHGPDGPQNHPNHLRIAMELVGQMLVEMSLTPGSDGGSLLDETLVYVYSDFGRTFPKRGSDHHPATCAILAGGNLVGNQMIGGYDESMNGSPMGAPSPITEIGSDAPTMRAPRSQDVAATVLHAAGLTPEVDFSIPGGYGVFSGVVRE